MATCAPDPGLLPARACHAAPIGILGGAFDPFHLGHLQLARGLRMLLGLERVLLIPTANPPHRPPPVADARQRCAMARLAIPLEDASWLCVDERELRRQGPSYMVDTLGELRNVYPDRPLCLLLGSDAAAGFTSWHRWRRVLDLAHLAVARRPGDSGMSPWLEPYRCGRVSTLRERPGGRVFCTSALSLPSAASTRIRALLGRRDPAAAALLPEAVDRYIREHGTYG